MPLVRDLVVPETFVPNEFSATQKMIDGRDDCDDDESERLELALVKLASAFASFEPLSKNGAPIDTARPVVTAYAELAEVQAMTVRMQKGATAQV